MYDEMIYGIFLCAFVVLLLLSAKEKVPEGLIDPEEQTAGLKKPFGKAAVFLWKQWRRIRKTPAADKRRKEYRASEGKIRRQEETCGNEILISRHDLVSIQKIQALLIFGMLAPALGLVLSFSARQDSLIQDGGRIERPSYEETQKDITATVVPVDSDPGAATSAQTAEDDTDSEDLGEFVIHVEPRKYTQEETDVLAEKAFSELPAAMIGESEDLEHVNHSLLLVKSLKGYPFQISWASDDYDVVDTDGSVKEIYEDAQDTSCTTLLTATLSYNGWRYVQTFPVRVVPVEETAAQREIRLIQEALSIQEKEKESDAWLQLPSSIDGQQIVWRETQDNTALLIFALVLAAGVVNCLLVDRRQQTKKEERRKDLRLEYPQLVSKFVLYLGAGMSVRNVFYKLGQDYEKERKEGGERKDTYEEILLSCHELDSGVSEAVVYGHFGQRCGIRQYTRLTTLLVQDLRKGNSELLSVLQEEAQEAIQERRQLARALGEEAGTKLLMPMIMMLAITMVIIIIPAFLGFSG